MIYFPGTALLYDRIDKYFKNNEESEEEYFVYFNNDKVVILPFKNKKEAYKCFKGIYIKKVVKNNKILQRK